MSVSVTTYPNREEWLAQRGSGIGASEISCVLGCGFKSPMELWHQKLNPADREDLSDNERVQFGNAAEEPLRAMFRLMHPEYELSFTPFMVLRQEGEYDFLFDTPDGLLVEKATGRHGLYESKTATCLKRADWEKWQNKIPEAYFDQICQGMFCGDLDFAVVWALLLNSDGDGEIRAYYFERTDCEWMIARIKKDGKAFWSHVQNKTLPPMKITF